MIKRKKSIPKPQKPKKSRVPNPKLPQTKVSFNLSYPDWLRGYQSKKKGFSTFLKDETNFAKSITYVLNTLIPKINNDWEPGKNSYQFKHCHEITINDQPAFDIYKEAIHEIHNIDIEQLNLWQFGVSGSIRLICHLEPGNTIYPLLIDYHHLGFESEKHNQNDTNKFSFCPITQYK
ncbi:hypothetical protein ACVV62_09235 [Streptococcus pluranimalium]